MKQPIKDFFEVFEWMPSNYGVESHNSPPMFFGVEHHLLMAAGIFWAMPILFAVMFVGLEVSQLFGFEPHSDPSLATGLVVVFCFCLPPALLQQTAKLLFLRKVNDEQLFAMLKWHKRLPGLPRPHKDMTKRDLALYVGDAYKKESETRKKNSVIDV